MSPDIAKRAAEVAEIARGGAAWLETNRTRLKEDPSALARDFRRFGRRAARLRIAADRPMCVAVFGASQAGKSYLVSSLATRPGEPLTAQYGDLRLNFLQDLNPQGGKESTGLVSRFTIRPVSTTTVAAPNGAPVPVRLMSQTDVIKILANAFLEDFKIRDMKLPDGPAITALFDRLQTKAAPAPAPGLTVDDIEELREYFDQELSPHPLLQALGPAYWARAADIIPRLPPEARAEAYAPLWNNTEQFTRVARQLTEALAALGFPETAFCGMDALVPRETSVLDADMVFGLGEAGRGPLRVVGSTGAAAVLDRAAVAALIAEITVPLTDRPWDFFEHTDLLDFPGARTREEITDPDSFLAQEGRLGRVFLRGKVAYLFQRYNAEQEITAMLLCVGPSNQDVQTLPNMIDRWIGQTIGPTPEARAQQRNSLFLVLTKFDGEFEDKAGEDVRTGQRWTARLQASLLDFFGKAHAWPRTWSPGQPFNNTFWLRSTAIKFAAVMDYEAGRETGVAPRATADVETRRQAYLANDLVRAHFADPAQAWAAALAPNDGGIGALASALRAVCDPRTKSDQVAGRIAELAHDMAYRLRPYYHTGDLAAELARAKREARPVARALLACAQAQMFGPLLRQMQVTADLISSVYWDLQSKADDTPVPIGTVGSSHDYRAALGGLLDDDDDDAPSSTTATAAPQARDRFDRFADLALAEWNRQLLALADDPATPTVFHLPRDQAATLVNEIMTAARRLDLRDRIAADLRTRASFQHRNPGAAQKPIMLVESAINGFVHMLDFDRLPLDRRPRPNNGDRAIFTPRPPLTGPPVLEEVAAAYDYAFHIDWIVAAARLFEDNVQDPAASGLDIPANEALGTLLRRLEAA